MENNVSIAAVRDVFTTVASYATAHAGFPVVLEKLEVVQEIVFSRFAVDGYELEFNMTLTSDAGSVARVLATHANWKANDIKASLDVPDLWCTWWQNCTANDDVFQIWWNDIATGRDEEFEAEAIQVKLEEIQDHVLAAVEADAEFVSALFKLAEVLRGYREQVEAVTPAEFGQIMQGMVETALVSENGTWFVETEDFVGEGAWHPEAWSEFLEDLMELRSRFGADMVDNLIAVVPGFDPTDEATWPADGIAATFYGDFLKLFDVSDLEA